jgi:hypothetical protein
MQIKPSMQATTHFKSAILACRSRSNGVGGLNFLKTIFSLEGHTAVVAGGAGVIGSAISETPLKAGPM